jgi:hypothetical protein
MDARTQGSGSTYPNGDEPTPTPAVTVESIEELRTAERSPLAELADLQNELGLTE